MFTAILTRLQEWLFDPPASVLGKPIGLLVRPLRYAYALGRDLARGELTLRAMSLVYTTLLSIVPLLALSFSVLKGLGFHRELEPVLYQFLEPIGDKAGELTARIMKFVDDVQGGVLGSIGLAFLIYTVVSMIQKIEESFNFVWRVEQPRSLARRFSEYLSVMVVGPVLIVAAFGLLAAVGNQKFVQMLAHTAVVGTAVIYFGEIVPYLLVIGVFTFLYAFVPNTKVKFRAALVGGAAAGILWVAGGMVFTSFVAASSQRVLIYAGFAIVIVALIWVYWSWLILLIGAQLAFYVQNPHSLRSGHEELHLTATLRERIALSVMYLLAKDFMHSEHRWSVNALSEQLELPSAALGPLITSLENAGLIVGTDDERLVPGRDLSAIMLAEIVDAVRRDTRNPRVPRIRCAGPAEQLAREADEALRNSLAGKTLWDLVE